MTYVYAISAGPDRQKIGISRNPQGRLVALRTGHYENLRLLYSASTPYAAWTEGLIHANLKPWRVRGEWFEMTPEEAIEFVRQGVFASLSWGFRPFEEGEILICDRTGVDHPDWGPRPPLGEIYTVARAYESATVDLVETPNAGPWNAYHFRRPSPDEQIDLSDFFRGSS